MVFFFNSTELSGIKSYPAKKLVKFLHLLVRLKDNVSLVFYPTQFYFHFFISESMYNILHEKHWTWVVYLVKHFEFVDDNRFVNFFIVMNRLFSQKKNSVRNF